jgi:hypothetical protein
VTHADHLMVRQVLYGLRFPAAKWQILTQADLYGADSRTRQRLFTLPLRMYRDCTDVVAWLPSRDGSPSWQDAMTAARRRVDRS